MKKIILIFLFVTFLSSCSTTSVLWETPSKGFNIVAFFADKENKRIVFVGGINQETKMSIHYQLKDTTGKLITVYNETELYAEKYRLTMSKVAVKGNDIWGEGLGFTIYLRPSLNKAIYEQLNKELKDNYNQKMKLAFVSFWRKSYKYDENIPFKNMMTRYPSKKEKFKNFCKDKNYYKYILGVDNPSKIQLQESKKDNKDCAKVIKLNGPWQAPVTTYNSNTQIAYKTVLTPFTIALDIISIPFVFIATIMAGIGMSDR